MKRVYQINNKYQIKSISNGLMAIPLIPVTLFIAYFLGYSDQLLDPIFVNILLLFYLILFLPAIILHFTYYLENRKTKLEVNTNTNSFIIQNSEGEILLTSDNVKQVIQVIYSDFRHPKWQQNWQPMPWRNYGYLKIISKDDKAILLTSLMLDPLDPPIKPTKTEFKYLPFLDSTIEKELTQEEIAHQLRLEVEDYKEKFQYLSEEEVLRKQLVNGFVKEAVIAAEEIIKERNTISTKI